MKHLIIIGARGWGRECYWAAQHTLGYKKEYDIKGFLDSDSHALENLIGDYPPILDSVEDYKIEHDDVFFCAMGDPQWRKHYADIIEHKGGEFISIISELAIVNENTIISPGCIIGACSIVSDNVTLEKHTMIHGYCNIGHDCHIGAFASIESYVFLGGHCNVGEMSVMHPKSMLIANKSIGNKVVVGAASVVMRNIKDEWHVHGNPAIRMEY